MAEAADVVRSHPSWRVISTRLVLRLSISSSESTATREPDLLGTADDLWCCMCNAGCIVGRRSAMLGGVEGAWIGEIMKVLLWREDGEAEMGG